MNKNIELLNLFEDYTELQERYAELVKSNDNLFDKLFEKCNENDKLKGDGSAKLLAAMELLEESKK